MAASPDGAGLGRRATGGWRPAAAAIGRAVATAAAVAWVWARLPDGGVSEALGALPRWTLALPLAAVAINTLLLAERHRLALRAVGHELGRGALVLLHLRSSFAALALPRGGADLARIAVLARQTGDAEGVVAAALHLRLIDLGLWAGFLAVFLGLRPWPGLRALELAAFGVISVTVAIGVVLPLGVRVAGGRVGGLPVVGPRLLRLVGALVAAGAAWRITLQLVVLGVPMAILNILSMSALFAVAGANLSWLRQAALVPAIDAVLALPITIGGVGLRETIFVMVGEALTVPGPASLAIAWTRWSGELGRALVGGLSLALPGGWGRAGAAQR